jgi:serine/threonine protein kinase
MPLRIEPHEEPIPGYRLIERIGSGGFGEVWKAEAPGGLFKAIKFVQRHLLTDSAIGNDLDNSRADQEWKSLLRVKSVRHPFILLLDRFENIDNFLVIVMELADRTLADRFKECRSQGLPGIPREELLGYMAEAAEVLDLMNSMYQLQHLDIKPQNLFLVHNHVKVADFGLVKDTASGGKLMTITGGVTPVYAAPETFDGKFSRQSDQYSLAIVYQEMLTGHRPFTGTSMKQLILQHMQNAHDLTPMPVHDRPIIAKALAKQPEDRFGTCEELVKQLRRVNQQRSGVADSPAPASKPLPVQDKAFPSIHRTVAARGISGQVKPADPNFSVGKALLGEAGKPDGETSTGLPSDPANRPTAIVAQNRIARPLDSSSHELPGIVQPAVIIGLGQLGIATLTQLRQCLSTEVCPPEGLPSLRFLALDTDVETLQHATTGDERSTLRTQETVLTRLQRPSHYLKARDGKLPTDSWLNPKLLYRIPREQTRASLRALGRLAFVDNYRVIARRLDAELRACCSQDTPYDSAPRCELGLRSSRPRVYIVTSLAGNTGSGMFLDVAYLARKLLNEQGHTDAEIVGLFYLPGVRREAGLVPALGNTYAALVELQHYSQANTIFSAHYETAASTAKGERVAQTGPAFQRCVLLPLPEPKGKLSPRDNEPIVACVGDFLYRDLATLVGPALDEQRQAITRTATEPNAEPTPCVQSIGTFRMRWPRHAMLERGARRLCSQLVTRWMNKDAKPLADTIQQWTHERWESLGMRSENLIERFQQLAEHALQQKPEQMLASLLAPLQQSLGSDSTELTNVQMSPIVQTMDGLEHLIGSPEELRASKQGNTELALLERSFADIAHVIADECEQKLAELAVALLEDPNYRLAGAEESLRQFCQTVEHSLQSQEILAKELADKAALLYVRIQQLLDRPLQASPPTSTKWLNIGRRPPASSPNTIRGVDLFELVRTYAKTRFHGLVLANLNGLYVGLRGHLSDQIREVGFCRQRLGELFGLVAPAANPGVKKETPLSGIRTLLPPGCLELNDVLERIVESVSTDDLLAFDERIQVWIRANCQALLEVCLGSPTVVKNLAPAMLQEAESFLSERLEGTSVAEMYLTRKRAEFEGEANDLIADDLQRCLDEATPDIGRIAENNEITLVSLPDDAPGQELRDLVRGRFKDAQILMTQRQDEMFFYHEIVNIQWNDLAQFGPIAQDCYRQRCQADPSSPHSREDVFEWQFIVECKK